jgi:hypothetical protein
MNIRLLRANESKEMGNTLTYKKYQLHGVKYCTFRPEKFLLFDEKQVIEYYYWLKRVLADDNLVVYH